MGSITYVFVNYKTGSLTLNPRGLLMLCILKEDSVRDFLMCFSTFLVMLLYPPPQWDVLEVCSAI